nr:MAG TPA: hypothetical protein [Caudoviricetes sp.]
MLLQFGYDLLECIDFLACMCYTILVKLKTRSV